MPASYFFYGNYGGQLWNNSGMDQENTDVSVAILVNVNVSVKKGVFWQNAFRK
jgi:hypothetical protein